MMTARSEHNDTGLTTKSRGLLPKGLDFRITQSVNACVYNEEGNSMAKSKAPMQLDYRTFDDKELTQVRQTAHAVGPAAKECRTSGKSYVVASFIKPAPAIYVFACDHPDARKPGIFIMYDLTRAGGLRSPAVRPASRFSSTPRAISSRH